MMYRCESCGHLFEEGEQAVWEERHGLDAPPYEKWSGCPVCGDGYEEVRRCNGCERWLGEDELFGGWCEECLRETINYETFFEYCEENKDKNYLDIFVMQDLLNCDEVPKTPSFEFHQLMIRLYKKRVEKENYYETLFGIKSAHDFLDRCIRFIMEDDGFSGRENYADWLNKREGNNHGN